MGIGLLFNCTILSQINKKYFSKILLSEIIPRDKAERIVAS
jgi:hypothetical protein